MDLVFITGGIRSGKSSLAVRWARDAGGALTYIATAEAGDAEMAARIERHRSERPDPWITLEAPLDLEDALLGSRGGSVVVDCLTLWVSNLMHAELADEDVLGRSEAAIAALDGLQGTAFVVTNEVGSGIVPDNALARRYEDLLGRVNVMWSRAAGAAFLVVAGRAIRLAAAE